MIARHFPRCTEDISQLGLRFLNAPNCAIITQLGSACKLRARPLRISNLTSFGHDGEAANHPKRGFRHLSWEMTRQFKFVSILLLLLVMGAMMPAHAQVAGPIAPPPKFKLKTIPAKPNPGAPPIPAAQIIQRFTQNEDLNKRAYDADAMDQTVKVEELVDNGGTFQFNGQQYMKSDGEHYEKILEPPTSNLRYTEFSLADVKYLAGMPLFFLTTKELPNYNLNYEGKEKLDQIDTYIFGVHPKQLGSKPLFDGVIWIDDQDFSIVKSYGHFVTGAGDAGGGFPFQMFDIYRENLVGRLWFPTYISSDSDVKTPQGSVPIRLIIRSSNFKPSAPAASPAATKPLSPAPAR